MTDTDQLPPRRRYTVPRWLAALSIAVGIGLPAIVMMDTRGLAGASQDQLLFAMVMTIILNIGYIIAPFMIGRGQWLSFFAGLALAPALAGWVSLFLPAALGNPLVIILAGLSGLALVGNYVFIFRHFAGEFFSNRKGGGPG